MCPGSTSGSTGATDVPAAARGNASQTSENAEKTRPPRILFLTHSLAAGTPGADATLHLAASLNASGADAAIVSFLPCAKARREQIRALGVPVRFLQFFNSGISFYAPGLTGTVLLFRPDAVVAVSTAAHLHVGPLARAFRRLRIVSLGEKKGLLRTLASRHCAAIFETPFPRDNASGAEREVFLKNALRAFLGEN